MADTYTIKSFPIQAEVSLVKSDNGDDDSDWVVEGVASTPEVDQQLERVLVKGLDLTYLQEGQGLLNWNHKGDSNPDAIVGVITDSKVLPGDKLFIKGKLLKSLPMAQKIRELMKALETDTGGRRKMGMSIEGKVLQRNGNVIVKAWVKAVALTMTPVNKATWVSFAKSLDGCTWADPATDSMAALAPQVIEEALLKELTSTSAGAPVNNTVHGTNPLMPESLEKDAKDTGPEAKKSRRKRHKRSDREKMNKSYTYDEALERIQELYPAVSLKVAKKIVDFTFDRLEGE